MQCFKRFSRQQQMHIKGTKNDRRLSVACNKYITVNCRNSYHLTTEHMVNTKFYQFLHAQAVYIFIFLKNERILFFSWLILYTYFAANSFYSPAFNAY